jgi:hypothetical protein
VGVEECSTFTNFLVILITGIPIFAPAIVSLIISFGAAHLLNKGIVFSRLTVFAEVSRSSHLFLVPQKQKQKNETKRKRKRRRKLWRIGELRGEEHKEARN